MNQSDSARILVVDDEPEIGQLLSRYLTRVGYTCFTATDGEAALKWLEREEIHLVLSDITMPGMDGYELCKRIKADEKTRRIPFVFVTSKISESDEAKGFELGALDYITKPISVPVLLARVRTHLALRSAQSKMEAVNQRLLLEIDERKAAEKRIQESLEEKETLLSEIHHRVKNNLQIISSLLGLQRRAVSDKKVAQALNDSRNRVRSMALIHEHLYRSGDLAGIDICEYFRSVTTGLRESYSSETAPISINIRADRILLPPDIVLPCGLILTELVSNSLKYAFPPDQEGEIRVQFQTSQENKYTLVVGDNGKGLPRGFDYRSTRSLGMRLVTELAEVQLEGSLSVRSAEGTEFKVEFEHKQE